MPGRLPTAADFPSDFPVDIIPPPVSEQKPINILILLHGLGDSKSSFSHLARQLQLPETACLSIQAPMPLPFDLGGFHWGDDVVFNQRTGDLEYDTGFKRSTKMLGEEVIQGILMEKCGYQGREVILFGFGQGAMAALGTVASFTEELGGVVSIGGTLPTPVSEKMVSSTGKNRTPILLLGGSSGSLITRDSIASIRKAFEFVEYNMWKRAGDSLPRSRQEMLPIMQFFSRRLRSRRGVPEGSVEIG